MQTTSSGTAVPRLALSGASKSFGAVRALIDGNLTMMPGEVHALLGENGAGKSTLVKILAGVHAPDTGTLTIDGAERRFASPADARDAGIAVIYQEPTLFFDLSIAENIYMGRQPVDRFGRIDYDTMHQEVAELLVSLGVNLKPQQLVRGLSIADQQVIEIAKALSVDANVLIMDEPTAALSLPEVERLFAIVRTLRERGAAILFITHRLEEVFALTQHLTIMRDGAKVFDARTSDMTTADIVAKMVGRDLDAKRRGGHGQLTVGAIMGAAPDVLALAVAALKTERPLLNMRILGETSDQIVQLLYRRDVELALGRLTASLQHNDFRFEPLARETLVLVVRARHPLAEAARVTLDELVAWPWIAQPVTSPARAILEEEFARANLSTPANVTECGSIFATLQLVGTYDAIAMLPESVVRDHVRAKLLVALPIEIGKSLPGYGILTRKEEPLSEPAVHFIALLRRFSQPVAN